MPCDAPSTHALPPDNVLNFLFTAELLLRMLSTGSILAYLSQPWNLFDAAMVALGYTAFIPVGDNDAATSGVRALRALRALRPLRTVTRCVRRGAGVVGVLCCNWERRLTCAWPHPPLPRRSFTLPPSPTTTPTHPNAASPRCAPLLRALWRGASCC